MQSVDFRNVRELLDFLPDDQLEIVERLREIIFKCLPEIEERLSFNVPFFKKHGDVFFIWPGAVPWGSKNWPGVEFGFSHGNLLADRAQFLEHGQRKQVFSKRFFSVNEIPDDLLRAYIFEATEIDEMLFMEKMKRKRRK